MLRTTDIVKPVVVTLLLAITSLAALALVSCGSPEFGARGGSDSTATFTSDALYQGQSIQRANEHLEFPLVVPEPVPSPLTFDSVTVHRPTIGTKESRGRAATFEYAVHGSPSDQVLVYQTVNVVKLPDEKRMQEEALRGASPATDPLPPPRRMDHVIAGQSVTETTIFTSQSTPLQIYSWDIWEMHFDVSSAIDAEVASNDLEQLVSALVERTMC